MSNILRFTDRDQLEHVSASVREQLERFVEGGRSAQAAVDRELERECDQAAARACGQGRREQPEQDVGRLLVEWIDLLVLPNGLRPGLFFFHVPNAGVAGGKVRGGILQGQGVRKGWPDYGLALPLGRFHGAWLELKPEDGKKPTAEQLAVLERLQALDYHCMVAWGFDDAKRQLEQYLDLAR